MAEKTNGVGPVEIVALADAAMTLLEKAIPQIANFVQGGQVDAQTQQDLFDRYSALKATGFAFTRPGP